MIDKGLKKKKTSMKGEIEKKREIADIDPKILREKRLGKRLGKRTQQLNKGCTNATISLANELKARRNGFRFGQN